MWGGEVFKGFILLKEDSLRSFSSSIVFITANNQGIGNRFQSSAAIQPKSA